MLNTAQSFLDQAGFSIELFRFLIIGGLIFTRFFILIMFLPYLGTRPIPGRVRIALSLVMAVFFYYPVSTMTTAALPTAGEVIVGLFLKEVVFAILMGLASGLVFFGIQAAGNMVDNQRQLANAQIFNPGIGSQASLFGIFYFQLAIVVFLTVGGHHLLFNALGKSFQAVPLLEFPQMTPGIGPVLTLILRLSADVFFIALQLGAPVLVAIFIADIILGLTNRVAPMVNVFEMGFNIKGFLGVVLAYLSLPLVYNQMKVWFLKYMNTVAKMVDLFMP